MAFPKVVVVTGASAGAGRATVRLFAKKGANVALIARGHDGLEGAKREVESYGRRALVLPTDVADATAVEEAAEKTESELGPIDVWVNVAMVSVFSPFIEMTAEEFKRVTEVTYLGYVYGTMSALRRMHKRNRGTIVQVGSALAYRSIPLQAAYCGAKHGIVGFTDSLRCELVHNKSKVRLTVVHMPALNTPQFSWVKSRLPRKPQPVPPIFEPEVAAEAIVYAARHPRREIWVGAPTVAAITGQKFIPGILDRYLGKTGFDSQQYDGAADPNRPNNLWEPLPGDHGAHGDFDTRAHQRSWQLTLDLNRRWIGLGLVAAGAAVALIKNNDKAAEVVDKVKQKLAA
ncbi:MAG TPA: SDR family oxidoreductase [Terriglobales bacterium]|nr:SDR family oxidoreductase [Terriglobales bacterium]